MDRVVVDSPANFRRLPSLWHTPCRATGRSRVTMLSKMPCYARSSGSMSTGCALGTPQLSTLT